MEKEKWYEKLKAQGQSITVPMTLLMIAVAVIPLLLQTWILIGSFKQNQIEARGIEIQNQCVILSNRMTRSGYMTADKANNVSLDAQMQTIADLYNGRIVIVNSSYKIMTDTFNLSTGKYYISEEVIRCFKGESGSSFNKEGGYFYQTIPVYDPADEKKIQGDRSDCFHGKCCVGNRTGKKQCPAVLSVYGTGGNPVFHYVSSFPGAAF